VKWRHDFNSKLECNDRIFQQTFDFMEIMKNAVPGA